MKYKKLNNTDLITTNICLGAGSFGSGLSEQKSFEILDAYAKAGGNFVDTANVYGKWADDKINHSEKTIGKWLKSRDAYKTLIVATKGGHFELSAPHTTRVTQTEVRADIEESLDSLGLDRIELYWLHRDDPQKPVEEIVDFMEEFVAQGKIRYYGASNYSLDRMTKAVEYAQKNKLQGFCAVQNRWSLAAFAPGVGESAPDMFSMTDEFYQWHKETMMPSIPYSATASGFFEKLNGNDPRLNQAYKNERSQKIYGELLAMQKKYGASLHALSLACLTKSPFETVPIGSVRNVEQLAGFMQASELGEIIEEDLIAKYGCQ